MMMGTVTSSTGNSGNGQMVSSSSMGSPFDNILNGGSEWNGGMSGPGPNQDPLTNLMDSVNSLDPLNSMGKSLNEQVPSKVRYIFPLSFSICSPVMAIPSQMNSLVNSANPNGIIPMNNNHRIAPQQPQQQMPVQQQQPVPPRNDTLAQLDLSSDLNFDPAAVIDGGGEGQEGLNVTHI